MSYEWDRLDIKQKIMVVTIDILHLLDKLCEKTKPGGEMDSAIETASESFEPLGKLLKVNLDEEDDDALNINTLLQDISSGCSVVAPEVAQLLNTYFKPPGSSSEKSESNESSVPSKHVNPNIERINELQRREDSVRHNSSGVDDEVLSILSHIKDVHVPSDAQASIDTLVIEKSPEQSLRDLSRPGPSGMSSKATSKERSRQPEDLSRPGPSGMSSKATSKERPRQPPEDLSQLRPSGMLSKMTSKERSRQPPEDSSQPGPSGITTESNIIGKDKLSVRKSVQSASRKSKTRKSTQDSKRTKSSVYESYTHYSSGEWRRESRDESKNRPRDSSQIY